MSLCERVEKFETLVYSFDLLDLGPFNSFWSDPCMQADLILVCIYVHDYYLGRT